MVKKVIYNATGSDFICNEKRYPAGAETPLTDEEAKALIGHPTAVAWLDAKMLVPVDVEAKAAKAAKEAEAAEAKAAKEAEAAEAKAAKEAKEAKAAKEAEAKAAKEAGK